MLIRKISLLVFMLFLSLVLIVGCAAEDVDDVIDDPVDDEPAVDEPVEDEFVSISLGNLYAIDEIHSVTMVMFKELVEEKSEGSIEIEFFPAGQTGTGPDQLEMVMQGTQDMFFGGTGWSAAYIDNHMHESLFFLFDNREQHIKFLESDYVRATEQQLLDQYNVRTIEGMFLRTPRHLVSTEPIQTLEDLEGKRWRVPESQGYLESADALASAVTIDFGEVYVAFQQGIVDIAEGIAPSVYNMGFHEVAPNITKTAHVHGNVDLWINEDVWQNLSANQQAVLEEAAAQAAVYFTEEMLTLEEEFFQKMEDEGATIFEFDEDEKARWKAIVAEQAVPLLEEMGAYDEGLYEEIVEFLEGQ